MATVPTEPEAFGEAIIERLRSQNRASDLCLVGPQVVRVNGRRFNLEDLYRMVKSCPERAEEIVESYLSSLFGVDLQALLSVEPDVARARILPRIHSEGFFSTVAREEVPHIPWVNGTSIVFVLDFPDITVSVSKDNLAQWGISLEEAESLATRNLEALSSDIKPELTKGRDGARVVTLVGGETRSYHASRLLLGAFTRSLHRYFGNEYYVGIPSRDRLIAFPAQPEQYVTRLKELVGRDFRCLSHPITDHLFLVTRDGIAGTRTEEEVTCWY